MKRQRKWQAVGVAIAVSVTLILSSALSDADLTRGQLVAIMLLALLFGVCFRLYNSRRGDHDARQ